MNKLIPIAALALLVSGAAGAREIQDGKLQVKPTKDGKYNTETTILGKAELWGYVGGLVEDKKITGITLRDAGHASDEQKHIIAITAQGQHIGAFAEVDGKESALVDPTPTPAAAAPAIEDAKPVGETH